MEDNDLKEILRRAAELASAGPESLREAAFKSAFDALMSGATPAGGGASKSATNPSSANKQKREGSSDDSDEDLEQMLHSIDRTAYPEMQRAKRVLDRALIVLHAANKDAGVDGLTASDVVRVLKEKFRIPNSQANYDAVRVALDRAGDKVDRVTRGGKLYFRIMGPGEDYVTTIGTRAANKGSGDSTESHASKKRAPKSSGGGKASGSGRSKESYSIDRNLDLRGKGDVPSFKDFYESKKPRNLAEFNAVAIYYLQKIAGIEPVTLNHVYTCYREVDKRAPLAFKQSFIDARGNKYGLIDI